MNKDIEKWLLEGDVSIQYQVYRDLKSTERDDLRRRIELEGWGAAFMSKRRADGQWGKKFYQPKWTSTHYTLLDLRNLCISPDNVGIQQSIDRILVNEKAPDGGILPIGELQVSDGCINGMFLNYASYFRAKPSELESVVDCILSQVMDDGGFNCRLNRSGATHSSLHTTLSILEGITEYELNDYTYRLSELKKAARSSREFILLHRLYKSHRTREIIHKNFLRFSYPCRWRCDILRALDYLQYSRSSLDERMRPALAFLMTRRGKEGKWRLASKHPGQVHFDMEQGGKPSRWNTLRALRVLRHFGTL